MTLPNERECVLGLMLDEHATQRPHEVMAVFDDGGMWTWAQAREAVRVTAGALRARGIRAGDLVGMWLPNCRAAIQVWWAVNWLGASLVPINTAYRGPVLEHVLRDSGIRLLVAHPDLMVVAPAGDAGLDPEDLLRYLVPRLPHYMVPRYADLGRLVSHVEARLGARLAAAGLAFGHFAMLTQWAAEGAPGDLQQRSDQLVRDIRRQLPTAVLS